MQTEERKQILGLLEEEVQRLGSVNSVARKTGISAAALSQIRNDKYPADDSDILTKIGLSLGYEFSRAEWALAPTMDYQIITGLLTAAKNESMWMGIANNAGSGKTAVSNAYTRENRQEGVFKIDCEEWVGRTFLQRIAREIGCDLSGQPYIRMEEMVARIGDSFKKMSGKRPLLILDQANSLKASALRQLIHLFNRTEDVLGLVMLGTEQLEVCIKRGVRLNVPGFDELDSRMGRKYVHLTGATFADVCRICEANGVTDRDRIKTIFKECDPVRRTAPGGSSIETVTDIRRLKRLVKREKLNI